MYDNIVNSTIIAPLLPLVGQTLKAVNYYYLWYGDDFDPERPNECGGCQGVHLIFDKNEVELDWDYRPEFRGGDGGIAYHLTASDHSIRREGLRVWTEDDIAGLNLISASETNLWKKFIDKPVTHLELLGEHLDSERCSPQALRLYFLDESIIIAIGMTPSSDPPILYVGDGDEVLVFSEQDWVSPVQQGVVGINSLICCWELSG